MNKSYHSFADYLYDRFYNEFASRIRHYIMENKENICSEYDVYYVELYDFRLKGVRYRGIPRDHEIHFRVSIEVSIICRSKGIRELEEDLRSLWLAAPCTAILDDGLHAFQICRIEQYNNENNYYKDSLSQYLVPYLSADELEEAAEDFLIKWYPEALVSPMPVDADAVIEHMHLKAYQAPLPENIFGKSIFADDDVEVFASDLQTRHIVHAKKGTILINPDVFFMRSLGSENNTKIHECIHHDSHGLFFEMQKLLSGKDFSSISCEVTRERKKSGDEIENALKFIEWQACALTPHIQMPKKTAIVKFQEIYERKQQKLTGKRKAVIMQEAVDEFASFFQVSRASAKVRLSQLGYPQAMGTFNFTDGEYEEPYYFSPDALKKGETFSLNERDYHFLYTMNPDFRSLITEELFVYADGFACIKDEKYVFLNEYGSYSLTEYARDHVDECCLIFQAKTIYKAKEYDDSFFTECYLCREVDASLVVEEYFDLGQEDNQSKADFARECRKIKKQAEEIGKSADEVPTGFVGTLKYHMDRKHMSIEDVSAYSDLSTIAVRNYLNGKVKSPGKTSVLALCKALNLNFMYSADLCKKAGHDLSQLSEENSLYMDLIVNHPMETIEQWNQKLEQWGMRTIPAKNG